MDPGSTAIPGIEAILAPLSPVGETVRQLVRGETDPGQLGRIGSIRLLTFSADDPHQPLGQNGLDR